MKFSKRLLAVISACALMTEVLPCMPVSAEEKTGTCGENITWILDDDGHLTISGTGPMESYDVYGSPFYDLKSEIRSVTIEEGVTSVGSSAFCACSNITEVTLPGSIDRLGFHAFEWCGKLESIKLPDGLETICEDCFAYCSSLKSADLPDSVTSIGSYAFGQCGSLTEFEIPPKVTRIESSLFNRCGSLEEITIPPTVTYIGGFAFSDTPWLINKRSEDPLVIVNNILVDGRKCEGSVTLPNTVAALAQNAFYGCIGMTDITLNSYISEIPSGCFEECTALTEIELPENVTSVKEDAFRKCDNLKKITFLNPDCAFFSVEESPEIPKNTTICGYEDSTAQAYAQITGQPFSSLGKAPSFVRGDVNGDRVFNVSDIVMFQNWLIGRAYYELPNWVTADFCKDGKLNVFDLCLMKRELFANKVTDYVKPEIRTKYGVSLYVIEDGLKLYLGPDESYPFVASLPETTRLTEYGYQKDNQRWIFTEYKGQYGWIRTVHDDDLTYTVYYEVMADKPVIYLYPEEETDVHVELELTEAELSTTYPKYRNGWDVTASPDGTLLNKTDGTHHKYLFWDAVNCRTRFDLSKGYCVAGGDTEAFLREKLTYMGLTEQEMNEFIVYWLPRMEHNAYNLISFQGDAYTDSAKLDISPAPDSLLRIFMTYVPLDEAVDIEPQQLDTFERNGFTVVEWGGCEIR